MTDGGRAWKSRRRRRWQRYRNRHAQTYDREMAWLDRVLFRDTRRWICTQATGQVLEVAIGTGLNIGLYPPGVALTGIDLSSAMLAIARRRAHELGRTVDLRCGNGERLTFPDASFDTVVCTFSLCTIPDHEQAVAEMVRVLRPGATLLLADHVAAAHPVLRAVQGIAELISVPLGGEHFRRRPIELVDPPGYRSNVTTGSPPVSWNGSPRVSRALKRCDVQRPLLPWEQFHTMVIAHGEAVTRSILMVSDAEKPA